MQPAPRKSRHRLRKSPLTEALILKWLVAQHRQTGQWPTQNSGPVVGVPGENWNAIDHGLLRGLRGLAGGSSLARLLAKAGLRRNPKDLPPLQVEQILLWAVDEYQSTG